MYSLTPGVGQDIALHVLPTARILSFPSNVFLPGSFTSVCPKPLQTGSGELD